MQHLSQRDENNKIVPMNFDSTIYRESWYISCKRSQFYKLKFQKIYFHFDVNEKLRSFTITENEPK